MKRLLLLHIILFSTIVSFGQAPVFEWARQIGATTPYANDGKSITSDDLGNVYITGSFQGTTDFDQGIGTYYLTSAGMQDVFVSKFDSNGGFLWAKQMGGNTTDMASSIAVDRYGNVYATGRFQGNADFDPGIGVYNLTATSFDVFISKLDASGNFVWTKKIGGNDIDEGTSISVDGSGNVYTMGMFRDSADLDPGSGTLNMYSAGYQDIFISKLDSFGSLVWAKQIGGISYDNGFSVSVDASGNVYATGNFNGTVDFDPDSGVTSLTSIWYDIFLLKLDNTGGFVWAGRTGGTGFYGITAYDIGKSVAVDNFGNVFTAGFFRDSGDFDPGVGVYNLSSITARDIYISKVDNLGNLIWAKQVGANAFNSGCSIAVDSLSNVYIVAGFNDTVDVDPGPGVYNLIGVSDVFISKLDAGGNFVWAKQFGGPYIDQGNSITVDNNGGIYTTGTFPDTVDFDPDMGVYNLISVGVDVYVHKLRQPPVGIQEYNSNNNSIFLYPNPTSNNLTIETTKPATISLVNVLGQELFSSKIETSATINVSFLAAGIYFVKDIQNGGSVKLVKQ